MPYISGGGGSAGPTSPGYELTYNQITGNVAISGNTEGTANTVITASAFTFPANPVMAEFFTSRADCQNTLGTALVVLLQEGATVLGRMGLVLNPATQAFQIPLLLRYRFTPTAASHTYSVTAYTTTGSATIEAGAGGSATQLPAYLRITRV